MTSLFQKLGLAIIFASIILIAIVVQNDYPAMILHDDLMLVPLMLLLIVGIKMIQQSE